MFNEDLRAVVAHGSSVTGGSISGWSDFDVCVVIGSNAFGRSGLTVEGARAAQAAVDTLGVLEAGYTYYSCSFYNSDSLPTDWPGFFPGAYRLLYGALPSGALATEERTRLCSEEHIRRAGDFLAREISVFAETHDAGVPGKDVFSRLRWLRTEMKHLMFSMVALASGHALETWTLDKFEALERFKRYFPGPAAENLQGFFDILCDLGPSYDDVTKMKEACFRAFRFFDWCSDPGRKGDMATQ